MIRTWWFDRGVEPKCPPNPDYPNGIDIDLSRGAESCVVKVAYPAERCGSWYIVCDICGTTAIVTTAGRVDDPRSVRLPCKLIGGKQ